MTISISKAPFNNFPTAQYSSFYTVVCCGGAGFLAIWRPKCFKGGMPIQQQLCGLFWGPRVLKSQQIVYLISQFIV